MDRETISNKAFWITYVIYTFDRTLDTMADHEDRLYRTVDNLLFLTEDQKAEFYALLAEKLTGHMQLREAQDHVTTALTKVLNG